jgi:hypothetical protein
MSAQIVKPFPLQFEYCSRYQVSPDTYGYPALPGAAGSKERKIALET